MEIILLSINRLYYASTSHAPPTAGEVSTELPNPSTAAAAPAAAATAPASTSPAAAAAAAAAASTSPPPAAAAAAAASTSPPAAAAAAAAPPPPAAAASVTSREDAGAGALTEQPPTETDGPSGGRVLSAVERGPSDEQHLPPTEATTQSQLESIESLDLQISKIRRALLTLEADTEKLKKVFIILYDYGQFHNLNKTIHSLLVLSEHVEGRKGCRNSNSN